jgi:hypothetical protein
MQDNDRDRISLRASRRMPPFTMASAIRIAVLSGVFLSLASCGIGSHSPTEPSCSYIGGSYDATFSNSCGGSGSGVVVVLQTGCTFTALIPGLGGGTVAGEINGRSARFTLYFTVPCSGSASGTATIGSTAISGTYSGGATGLGCCNPVSGSFILPR